ncbi:hypothetical protein DPMN_150652 [Dreissena polymorpha]|uniref:Uncharacterized protein n=1 Tax=Dreissena polymorpha TaxID=45954 RepID=A0A9D4J6I9_DREPO|nr:hypothetical protein DPMN_150652 [Dreissena polymorpha]
MHMTGGTILSSNRAQLFTVISLSHMQYKRRARQTIHIEICENAVLQGSKVDHPYRNM